MTEVFTEFVNAARTAANVIEDANAALEGKTLRDACVGRDDDASFDEGGAIESTEVAAPVAEEEVPPTPLEE